MAGKPKQGIEYAGWSVTMFDSDDKIDLLLDACGWDGFGIYFYLCTRAFGGDGYYYKWGFASCASTARRMGGGIGSFQSTRPVWGVTAPSGKLVENVPGFQSTRPVWGVTVTKADDIPRVGISIHTPRVGRDVCTPSPTDTMCRFQSTRPVWGVT